MERIKEKDRERVGERKREGGQRGRARTEECLEEGQTKTTKWHEHRGQGAVELAL